MAIHEDFPKSPHEIIHPDLRWFPTNHSVKDKSHEKLLPPLVSDLREKGIYLESKRIS